MISIDFRDESEAEEDAEKQSVEPAITTVNEDATVTAAIGTKDAAEPTNADANADAKPDVGMEDASADAEPCPDAPEDAEMQDKDESGEDEVCEDDPVIEDSCCWPASIFICLYCSLWKRALFQMIPMKDHNEGNRIAMPAYMTNMTSHDYATIYVALHKGLSLWRVS